MMRISEMWKASVLLVGIAASACAVEGAPSDEASSAPIAEVELANGSRVMFFEPSPGALAVGEESAMGVPPVDTSGKSPLEIYRSIAPDRDVPDALVAAQKRADDARRDRPVREVPEQPATKSGPASITASGFDSTYCQDTNYFNINCHLGPNENGVTGELDGTHYDIDEFRVTMCVNSGKVELRIWVDDEKKLDIQKYSGCLTYHWWSGLFNADSFRVKTDILVDPANYFLTVKWNH